MKVIIKFAGCLFVLFFISCNPDDLSDQVIDSGEVSCMSSCSRYLGEFTLYSDDR